MRCCTLHPSSAPERIRPESLHLNFGGADHLGPLLGFIADELAEVLRRAWQHRAAEVGEPRLYVRIGKRCIDLAVELFDDSRRRVFGCNQPDPLARLEARNELAQ